MKKKNKKLSHNIPPAAIRTIGGFPVRDAKPSDGIITTTCCSKDWDRGLKNDPRFCVAGRALARALGFREEEVKKYGLAILDGVAYIPMLNDEGEIEVLRYRCGSDVHKLWDEGKFIKPRNIRFHPMTPSQTLEAKRIRNKKRRAAIRNGTHKPIKRGRIASRGDKSVHVRGDFYNHHSCVEAQNIAA